MSSILMGAQEFAVVKGGPWPIKETLIVAADVEE